MQHTAVITGMGAVAPNGIGLHAFAHALRNARSGVSLISPAERGDAGLNPALDTPRHAVRANAVAACRDFSPETVISAAECDRLPRLVPMALDAAGQAISQSQLDIRANEHTARATAVVLGTGAGGIDFTLSQADAVFRTPPNDAKRPPLSLWTITNATHGNLAGELSIALGAHGPSHCVSDGCASSSDALAHALNLLRSDRPGTPDAAIVVGADAHLRWETILGMQLLGVMSTNAEREPQHVSRPFDADRDGFVLGEGAWAVVLETPEHAERRGAKPIATIEGVGITCDAYHRVRPAPDMAEATRAIHLAIDDANVTPTDIDLVHYHGTSTKLNDRLETHAMRCAFDTHATTLRGHSVKSMIGHPQGASGLAALVSTLAGLTNADRHESGPFVFPTINLDTPDPDCDLDYTPNHAAPAQGNERFLINCLAFGAKNTAIVGRATP